MTKAYRLLTPAIFILFNLSVSLNVSAQKNDHDEREGGKRQHLMSWPRQKITHKLSQIGPPRIMNFRALADSEKVHPPVKRPMNSGPDEGIEERFKYKPKRIPAGSPVFNFSTATPPLIESPAPIASFNGTLSNATVIPPDIQGAAGPLYVMETTNQQFDIYNKNGTLQTTLQITDFFSNIPSTFFFDPHILYDPNYQRFIVCIDDGLNDGNSGLGFAVSETSDPTGNWYVYQYETDIAFTDNTLLDYPELGYNNNWVVVTGNDFENSGVIGTIYVMNRADLYAGTLGTVNVFTDNNAFTWVPAQTYTLSEDTEYMVQTSNGDNAGYGYMQVGSITGTANAPVYNAGATLGVNQTFSNNPTLGASQEGNANTIDADDSRVENGVVYLNGTVWFTHSVFLPPNNSTYIGVDWWQVNPKALTVLQFGRIADANKNTDYYYPNLNVNSSGDALLGYCVSGTDSFYGSAAYSFHAAADPANYMESRYIFKSGVAGYYETAGTDRNRWGDFTGTAVDPMDNSFWTLGEWAETGNNWGTQIAHVAPSVPPAIPPVANFSVNDTLSNCTGIFQFTDLSTESPTSWLWNFGDGTTSTLQNPEHEYTANGTYTVTLTATNAYGHNTLTQTNYITVDKPAPPAAANESACGPSTFSLSASTGNSVTWYDSSGNKLSAANPFITPVLSQTTTYYVEDTVTESAQNLGPATQTTLGAGGFFGSPDIHYLIFDAYSPFTLISVLVDAQGAGNRTILLNNSAGTLLQSKTVNLTSGVQTVTLNFDVPMGTAYQLSIDTPANLYRNNGDTGNYYPFTIAGLVSITNSDVGNGYYYFFYNWKVQSNPCISARTAVKATVNPVITGLNPVITNALCNGGATGSVSLTPSGGTPGFKYNWSNGQTTNPVINLDSATYLVTVTDAANCSLTASESVSQPLALDVSVTPTNSGCTSATGSAVATPSGGTSGYTYHWNTGATTVSISNLSPATYGVTVTDAHSCTASGQATVINTGSINLSVTATSANCFGTATGSATAAVTSDTNAVHYVWNTGATVASITNVVAATYQVTATDALGCSASVAQTVSQPSAIDVSVSTVNNVCGSAIGSATASASGGTSGYTYLWSTGATTATISGLAANTYHVTAYDAHSCTATNSATIINTGSLDLSVTPTTATCFGSSTGSALANVTGDINTVNYIWNTTATTASITNVAAGNYSVTASDNTGCSATITTTISQPTAVDVSVSFTNNVCGTATGSATAVPSGGTSGYTYLWSNSATTATISNLIAGTYHVTAYDAHSCTATNSATIINTGSLDLSVTPTSATCFGSSTGSALANVTGDINTVNYVWNTTATTASITNVAAGNYSVTTSDNTGCSATTTTTISQPTAVDVSVSFVNNTCGTATGSATAVPSGGTSGYTYLWSNSATTATISNLIAGTYHVTAYDAHSCTATNSATIINTGSLDLSVTPTTASCFGSSTGSALANVIGDINTVNYVWNTTATTASITNVPSGNYSVTASDNTGCSATITTTISQPTAVDVSVSFTNNACGSAAGSATAVPSGGTSGYTYLWSNTATTVTISNLAAGTYHVTAYDAHSCTATNSATIINTGSLDLSVTPTSAACFGSSTGSALAYVTGDINTVNYVWNTTATTASITNVAAGNYSVTASDNTGCSATITTTISQPTAVDVSVSFTNNACGSAAGSATAVPSGGTSGYTYLWSNTATTVTISNLAAGTYHVTAYDAHSCTATNSATIINTGSLDLSVTPTSATCFGSSTGSALANVIGDINTVNYVWNTTATTASITNVAAGNYSVTASDNTGCSATTTTTISQPTAVDVSVSFTNNACGTATGSATATPSGGTSGYTYLWSNSATTSGISNLAAGTYHVTVHDAHSCTATNSATIINTGSLDLSVTPTSATCFGSSTGSALANVIGDINTVNYVWNTTATTASITNVPSGNYSVTASDNTGCSATTSTTISQPTAVDVSVSFTNSACGSATGNATATPSGGTSGYTYLWSNTATSTTISNLAAGTYHVTAYDAHSCTATNSATIINTGSLDLSVTPTSATCFGSSTGSALAYVTGDINTVNYVWSTTATTASITNVAAGNYSVTASDNTGCSATTTTTISQPTAVDVSVSFVNNTCGTATGSATAVPSGGTSGYTYLWSNSATTVTISNLAAGTYHVTAYDAHSCTATNSATIINTGSLDLSVTPTSASCFGSSTGSALANVIGDINTVNYVWNTAATTASITNVPSGNYSVTASDNTGCSATTTTTISQPTAADVSVSFTNSACGSATGTATATPSGGISGYTYLWSNSATTATISNLIAGTYHVTAYDAHSCTATNSATIINTGSLDLSVTPTSASCFGASTGSALANVTGDINTVNYVWNTTATTASITNVAAGNYSVTASDNTGCSATTSTTISQPTAVDVSVSFVNNTCGTATGSATAVPSGGTSGYTYLWSNTATSTTISNLAAGTYHVTAYDAHSCTATNSATIINTGSLDLSVTPTSATCFGSSTGSALANVIGDINTVNYVWNTTATTASITNVPSGNYSVTASDNTGCSATSTTTISQPTAVDVSVSFTNSACGSATGTATAVPSGGTSGYTYLWSNSATTVTISNLAAGTYHVTAYDAHSCTATNSATIINTGSLDLSVTPTSATCFGSSTGSALANVTGDINTVNYIWNTTATTASITNVPSGNYSVTASDNTGCSATTSTTISQPTAVDVSVSFTNSACGSSTGSVTAVPSGGTSGYTYLWSNSATTVTISNLAAGTYHVTVHDAHSCTATNSATIVNTGSLDLSVTPTSATCFGSSTGSALAYVTGDINTVNYVWSTTVTTASITNVAAGNYSVTASDNTGCSATTTTTISQPTAVDVSVSFTNSACGSATGTATATPSGGTSGYTYLWSNTATTTTISNLAAGTYHVTVYDAHSCTATNSATIINTGSLDLSVTPTSATCFGSSTGSALANVTGDINTVNYVWNTTATTASITNVAAGNYSVTASDNTGCSAITTTTISQPTAVDVSVSFTNSACGSATGTATATPSGGTSGYTYLWNNSATTVTISNLAAGTYHVTVHDAHSCTATNSATIINTGSLDLSVTPTSATCFGSSTGSALANVTGDINTVNYVWSTTATTASITNVAAGNYSVTASDNTGCSATTSTTISQPTAVDVSVSFTNSACGSATGTATATPSGGTSGYTYLWSNTATTTTISNLAAGTYHVTVHDAHSCTATNSATIINTGSLDLSVTPTSATCFGSSTGSALANVTGDINTVNYVWNTTATTASITNVAAGNYSVTASDNTGCSAKTTTTISQPTAVDVSVSFTNSACGSATGTATATPSGGTSGYTYLWSTSATTVTISNLAAGTYHVTVHDAHSCTATNSATIINTGSLDLSVTPTSASCFGASTGSALANVTGDINTVNYVWSTTATTASITNVAAGNYSVTASDNTGCSATTTTTISQPTAVDVSVSFTNSACGSAAGSATAVPSGGTSGYTYLWSNTATTTTISNLAAGTYHVTVYDAHSCTATNSATIINTGSLDLSVTPTSATCFGSSTGSALANVTGDINTVNYVWNTTATTASITNVAAGNYSVTAFDNTGCSATSTTTISEPTAVDVSVSFTNSACGSATGTATATPSGGTSGYTYLWSNTATTTTISNLAAGTYHVTVYDAHSCTGTNSATIINTGSLDLSVTPTSATCFGSSTGSALAYVTGDINTVNYVWSTTATTASITNVVAGNYSVTASDNTGCSATSTTTISQPTVVDVSVSFTNSACGSATGNATATPSGGTSGYTYLWSTSATTTTISNLAAGTYHVTAYDAHSCTATNSATIINTGSLDLSVTPTSAACFGSSTGSALAYVTGDINTVNYVWNTTATTASITNVAAGNYSVTASDNTGCSATITTTISQPTAVDVSVSFTNSACGSATGSATAVPSGGTSGYTYLWSNTATTVTISNLAAGTYHVTAYDAHSCTATNSATIINTGSLDLSVTPTSATCFGSSTGSALANVIGDINTVNYVWNTTATTASITNVVAGNYSVTASDNTGCSATTTTTISQPQPIAITIIPVNAGCGVANGSATAGASGGTPGYTFLWSTDSITPGISGLAADIYSVTVTDSNSCTASQSVRINGSSSLTANLVITPVTCYESSDGSATVNVTNGNAPFGYLWSNGSTTSTISGVPAGNYILTITDSSNCQKIDTVIITQPTGIIISITGIRPACNGGTNGSIGAQVSGGTPSYIYSWSNHSDLDSISNLAAGVYSLTVYDNKGCSVAASDTLNGVSAIVSNVIASNDSCYGEQSATAHFIVSGGASPYTFNWSNGDTGDSATALAAGNYTVTITDVHSCTVTAEVSISQPQQIQITVSSTGADTGQDNGSATIDTITGGTPSYNYKWSNGQTTLTATDLTPGNYSVTVTDQSSCNDTASITVKEITGIAPLPGDLSFNIYPNPAKNEVTIEFNAIGKETSFMVKDVLGQALAAGHINSTKTTLDLSNFADGVYFIEVIQDDKRAVQQLILSR